MMTSLSKLKKSELILAACVISILVLGIYGFFRAMPVFQEITKLQKDIKKTELKVLKAKIPEEPEEDIDQINASLTDQEQAVMLVNKMAESINERLAPFDSQEVKVSISQLARKTKVRIRTNESFAGKLKNTVVKKPKKKTKSSNSPEPLSDLVLDASHSWVNRMASNTLFYRPMQRLELEGEYTSLRAFIHELDNLPWQVTVIRIKIEKLPTTPLRGYAQALSAELILAL